MKKKSLTYFLLPVAFAVWGIIGYKIWKSISKDEEIVLELAAPIRPLSQENYFLDQTPVLKLDYPDPFLNQLVPITPSVVNSDGYSNLPLINSNHRVRSIAVLPATTSSSAQLIVWPMVDYRGIIENRQRGTRIAILAINGTSYLFKERQNQQNITLIHIYSDSVSLSFKNQQKTVQRIGLAQ